MATAYGSNFTDLGANLRAAEALDAQRTSDILRNLNATAQGLMASRDRRYATDAERERVAAQERLGRTQEANNLAIEQERNRLFGRQISEQAAAEERATKKQEADRDVAYEIANAHVARFQTIYADSMAEADKATRAAKIANEQIAKLKAMAKSPETEAKIVELQADVKEATAMAAAATRQATSAKQSALSIGADSGFMLDDTGPRWKVIDRLRNRDAKSARGGAASIADGPQRPTASTLAEAQRLGIPVAPFADRPQSVPAPPIGVEIFGQTQGPVMPGPSYPNARGPRYVAPASPIRSTTRDAIQAHPPAVVPRNPRAGWGTIAPTAYIEPIASGASAFGQEPATLTGQAIERGYFSPRIEPGGRIFYPDFEDVFPDGVSGGLTEPPYTSLPVFQFGATESDGVTFPPPRARALGLPENFDPRPEWQRLGY